MTERRRAGRSDHNPANTAWARQKGIPEEEEGELINRFESRQPRQGRMTPRPTTIAVSAAATVRKPRHHGGIEIHAWVPPAG